MQSFLLKNDAGGPSIVRPSQLGFHLALMPLAQVLKWQDVRLEFKQRKLTPKHTDTS